MLSHAGNPERFHEVNERFHNAIYAGSQNGYIAEMTLATRVRVQPFRRAQFRNLGRLAKSHAEHDRVVVAIMRGDKAGAAAAMRAHIELVRGEYELYAVSVVERRPRRLQAQTVGVGRRRNAPCPPWLSHRVVDDGASCALPTLRSDALTPPSPP